MNLKKITVFLFLIFLAAIAANAQKSYKSAAQKIKLAGKTIVVKSEAYVNLMPTVIDENQKQDCAKTGTLIAPVTIETVDNSRLPSALKIERLWIRSGGIWRQYLFNKDETSVRKNSIYSVARGCPDPGFKIDEPVKIVVEIKRKGRSYFIASSQTQLEKAY